MKHYQVSPFPQYASDPICRRGKCGRKAETRGYCKGCYWTIYNRPDRSASPESRSGGGNKLTAEQKADVVKRSRRFESPLAIAKFYGVSRTTVMRVLKESREAKGKVL